MGARNDPRTRDLWRTRPGRGDRTALEGLACVLPDAYMTWVSVRPLATGALPRGPNRAARRYRASYIAAAVAAGTPIESFEAPWRAVRSFAAMCSLRRCPLCAHLRTTRPFFACGDCVRWKRPLLAHLAPRPDVVVRLP